jgi:hypothetical protein
VQKKYHKQGKDLSEMSMEKHRHGYHEQAQDQLQAKGN